MKSTMRQVALTGTRLGRYDTVALIGAGGMGEVYRARDARLGRDVAIKVLPAAFAADADRLRRFEQEARAAARAQPPEHPRRPRRRPPRRRALHRLGAARRRDAARPLGGGALPLRKAHRLRHPDRRRAGGGARQGHRASRPEAREHLRDHGRARQDPRLRPRQAGASATRSRSPPCPSTVGRRRAGHGRLHVARSRRVGSRPITGPTSSAWARSCSRWSWTAGVRGATARRRYRVLEDDPPASTAGAQVRAHV